MDLLTNIKSTVFMRVTSAEVDPIFRTKIGPC